jgi:hypothetical protein
LAQDDQSNTASSDPSVVAITAPLGRPTVVPDPANPTPAPSTTEEPGAAKQVAQPSATIVPDAPTRVAAGSSDHGAEQPAPPDPAAPAPAVVAEVGASSAAAPSPTVAAVESAAGPQVAATVVAGIALTLERDVAPGPPSPAPAVSPQSVELPATAAAAPAIASAVALVLLGLVVRSIRRVRRAGERLMREGVAVRRLVPLLRAASHLQHTTAADLARARERSQEIAQHVQLYRSPRDEMNDLA